MTATPRSSPPGGTSFNPDYPALPTTVYNETTSLQFVVAGGFGPYTMKLYDAPGVDDGNLPLGIVIASESPNLVGAPVEVKPGGAPFLLTFELTDSVGSKGYFTVYWKIDTPPIIVASETLADGVCGQQYSDSFAVAEGVPPFNHELVEVAPAAGYTSDVNPNPTNPAADVLYNPDGPPTVNPPAALNKIDAYVYPAPSALGPDYAVTNQGAPPEGLYLIEDTGAITGVPRRRGTFAINYHVTSALVPNSFGQHAWKTFQFTMAQAPSFTQDPSYTIEGVFRPTAPYARISDFEQGQVYNPDGGVPGLQLLASGGVPQDGLSDHPHASRWTRTPSSARCSARTAGRSTGEPRRRGLADPARRVPLHRRAPRRAGRVRPARHAGVPGVRRLGERLRAPDVARGRLDRGHPDLGRTGRGRHHRVHDFVHAGELDLVATSTGLNDPDLTSRCSSPSAPAPSSVRLDDAKDMAGTGANQLTLPSTAGQRQDAEGPAGGRRPPAHLRQRDGMVGRQLSPEPEGRRRGPRTATRTRRTATGATTTPTILSTPAATSTATGRTPTPRRADPGVHDAGRDRGPGRRRLHERRQALLFDSSSYIGVFIVRPESKVYVPIAFNKSSTGYYSFGDVWVYAYSTTPSSMPLRRSRR